MANSECGGRQFGENLPDLASGFLLGREARSQLELSSRSAADIRVTQLLSLGITIPRRSMCLFPRHPERRNLRATTPDVSLGKLSPPPATATPERQYASSRDVHITLCVIPWLVGTVHGAQDPGYPFADPCLALFLRK